MSIEHWQAWLYSRLRAYEQSGRKALHPTLDFMRQWDAQLKHPHRAYPIIHIAGTNGKGSTSAFLAAILQAAGYRVGLHTSPHLWRFTERMLVNGQEPPDAWVEAFLSRWQATIEALQLSFFEATVGMTLARFADAGVDIAIVEVGLGGRWDATNIITPLLSVITPIGWDHVEILGPTIKHIAAEKAGIIKPHRPVILARQTHPEVLPVVEQVAHAQGATLIDATHYHRLEALHWAPLPEGYRRIFLDRQTGQTYASPLTGDYQAINLETVLTVVDYLRAQGWDIPAEAVREGIETVHEKTCLYGRGQWVIQKRKVLLFDVAHNPHGFAALRELIRHAPVPLESLVIGFSGEKDIPRCLEALGGWRGRIFFTAARNSRALAPQQLQRTAASIGYSGEALFPVERALSAALDSSQSVLVTGSVYLVAEALSAVRALSDQENTLRT